ncbi:hypothetical protein PR202_ga29996 [Eleusine coracana subsp. coracana]|uniref:Serpin domain-containing protein n=1 Tax=Eleusine coracana subsp. coracana TaxID=191504 RepID=A0AAV5DNK0_ELECO|nr:hypothetical protein PR202_ga29996 [Eleusine coracana subsp. coracana]
MEEAEPGPSKKPRLSTGGGLTAFTLRLAKKLSATQDNDNVIFSPLSIYAALALVAAGARGATLDEIILLLGAASRDELAKIARTVADRALADDGSSSSEEGGLHITFASGIWHDKTVALKPAYRAAAVESYKAVTCSADFKEEAEGAREEINKWVSEATNNLITSILPRGSVNSSTRLVLANVIYFNGTWSEPFAKKQTRARSFYRLDGSSVDTPFMRTGRDQFVARHDGFKVLKMTYRMSQHLKPSSGADDDETPRLSMCVFLPDARDGLPWLMDTMQSDPASFLRDYLPQRRISLVEFLLPKFKLSFSSRIDGVLRDMGIKAAFDAHEADLSDMCEGGASLAVEKVFHKAVLEVNEEGTVAAASTAFILRKLRRVLNDVPVDFIADHPFAFFVVDEVSGAVIFAGQVLDPATSM